VFHSAGRLRAHSLVDLTAPDVDLAVDVLAVPGKELAIAPDGLVAYIGGPTNGARLEVIPITGGTSITLDDALSTGSHIDEHYSGLVFYTDDGGLNVVSTSGGGGSGSIGGAIVDHLGDRTLLHTSLGLLEVTSPSTATSVVGGSNLETAVFDAIGRILAINQESGSLEIATPSAEPITPASPGQLLIDKTRRSVIVLVPLGPPETIDRVATLTRLDILDP
jgi:hypothetical protein